MDRSAFRLGENMTFPEVVELIDKALSPMRFQIEVLKREIEELKHSRPVAGKGQIDPFDQGEYRGT